MVSNNTKHNETSSTALVISAISLSNSEKKDIQEMLVQRFGADVSVDYQTDADVLGGVRIEAGDWVFDTTVASELKKLTNLLQQ